MRSSRRLHKSPSESTLMLNKAEKDRLSEVGAEPEEISHSKKRLAKQHDEQSGCLERASEWLRTAKPPRKMPTREHAVSSGSISTLSCEDIPFAFESSRDGSWIEIRPNGSGGPTMEGSGATDELLNEGWQNTEACSLSDQSDFDRHDITPEDRTHLSRIGSQLTFTLSPSMGISQRKRLLTSLSERVEAHEAMMFQNQTSLGGSPSQTASYNWRRSFSATTAEMKDLAKEQQNGSRRNSQEEDSMSAQKDRKSACGGNKAPVSSSNSQQAAELCLRLNHARQTMVFVNAQAAKYSKLDKAEMDIWEALDTLAEMKECGTTFLECPETEANICILDHAHQTAEACRLAHPDAEWLQVVGLVHSLGRLLAHKRIGGEPQWAVCGESFPVGCKFDQDISFHHYFSVNPDRRRRQYNQPYGIYAPGVGLASVYMSWSASEYLYMLLLLNKTNLPPEALFVIRYQKFLTLQSSKTYRQLMNQTEKSYLPWLESFKELSVYKQMDLPERMSGDRFKQHYSELLRKYIPQGRLKF